MFFYCALTHSQESQPIEVKAHTPRIALVLGGGGARGAAHIGVLELLEQEHVPITCMVGTSMGGLTAGAFAAGLSPTQMREKLDQADWADMFLDSADYSQMGYRNKRATKRFLSGTQLGVTQKGLQLKPGVIAGTKIKLFFNHLIGADKGDVNIENLPIPIAIIATDIGTGQKYIFNKGNLSLAMRASMSVPGIMTPVDIEGHKLVDGGLVDNLPVTVARKLCNPDIIIAVNVSSKLKPADQVNSLLSITGQMIGILTNQNVAQSIASLTPKDIYIKPDLGDFSATDFAHYTEAANLGYIAAKSKIAELKSISLDPHAYAQWKNSLRTPESSSPTVTDIVITPSHRKNYIAQHIHQPLYSPLDRAQLEKDLIHLYGDGNYENVDYRIETKENKNILNIYAKESAWSSDYITFGFDINNEYRQGTSFDLRGAYRSTWLNNYGGELFLTLDIGSNPGFEAEFYQPLNSNQSYFIQPSYYRKKESLSIFSNDTKVAEYELSRSYSEFSFGKNVDVYGQLKLGWREYAIKSVSSLSNLDLQNINDNYGGAILDLSIDRRNRLHFPSRGWSTHLSYFESHEQRYGKINSDITFAYPLENFVLAGNAAYISSTYGSLPSFDAAYLGGFLNLSAYASNQIIADNALYTHIRGEQIIGRMPLGLNGDLRLGLGLESARLKKTFTYDELDGWINSAVVYLGGETPLGPAYLGVGFSEHGNINIYLQIGAH